MANVKPDVYKRQGFMLVGAYAAANFTKAVVNNGGRCV